jgi:4-amino-4-deoxychorismate lyase
MTDFPPQFRVIETLGWSANTGALRQERHLARMARTCHDLDLPFPEAQLRALLDNLHAAHDLRVRLTVDAQGQGRLEHWPLLPTTGDWAIAVSDQRLDSADPWLARKTTNRTLYDTARAALPKGVDELIFLNEHGEVCEGTITNVFVQNGDTILTPPVSCGLLPGVLRAELLQTGRACEAVLTLHDMYSSQALYCGNSLRGLIPVRLITSGE